ncbi:MAG: hypothetical protein V7K38_12655 [Nostoc sp.]
MSILFMKTIALLMKMSILSMKTIILLMKMSIFVANAYAIANNT